MTHSDLATISWWKYNAQNIDYDKLKKMADWMYRTGWKVANATERPAKDANFKLER